MRPIDAAAADSLRKAVGNAQKLGMKAIVQAPDRIRNARLAQRWPLKPTEMAMNTPHNPRIAAVCQRRSPVRSESQPFQTITKTPNREGSAAINVTLTFGRPVARLRIVGNQKLNP